MVKKKVPVKKVVKKNVKVSAKAVDKAPAKVEALSVDDALEGYEPEEVIAPAKKSKGMSVEEMEGEMDAVEQSMGPTQDVARGEIIVVASKPIGQIKKGDKITIDGGSYDVDAHYIMIDHGSTKEMAIELVDSNDKDFQLRYFDDQVESTLDLYELQEIMYFRRAFKKISW